MNPELQIATMALHIIYIEGQFSTKKVIIRRLNLNWLKLGTSWGQMLGSISLLTALIASSVQKRPYFFIAVQIPKLPSLFD